MDRTTPLDLENARPPIVRKGFDPEVVGALLKSAANELSNALRLNEELVLRTESDRRELDSFRSREKTLADALLLAQKTADDVRALAQRERETILAEARREAETLLFNARQEVVKIESEISELKRTQAKFDREFKALLTEHLESLEPSSSLRVEEDRAA